MVIAIRHGETEWNREQREIGQLDSPLTQRGIEQARALAQRLCRTRFDALYSSDLGRAVQTAEIIGTECRIPVKLAAGLRERHMGIFQGLTVEEMRQKFPREREEYERLGLDYVIPGGESARQRLERSVRTLTSIAQTHAGQSVVVVTHGGFLTGFFEFVLGMQPGNDRRFRRANCSYNTFVYSEAKWCLETWNDTSHLEGIAELDDWAS